MLSVGSHREYWEKHPLPVFGIAFVPTLKTAYGVDIKGYLKANPNTTLMRYRAGEANRFDGSSCSRPFVPAVVRETPTLTLEEAFTFVRSDNQDEQYMVLLVLFWKYLNAHPTWDELVRFFVEHPRDEIPNVLTHG